jgi:AcrR family transcriptional regulator
VEGTRERIVGATTGLFSRQGYNGTGVKQIVAEANAPFGSLYHFFPGGKAQLGEEVVRWSGRVYEQLIDHFFAAGPDVVGATAAFFAGAAEALEEMDFADPCPVATVSMEVASTNEPLRVACADVFARWIDRTAGYLEAGGVPAAESRALATTLLGALQGGFMLGRAARDAEPVRAAGRHAVAAVAAVRAAP